MTTCLAAYLHAIDPFVVRFPDAAFLPGGIRWYGVSYLLGFIVGYWLIRRITRVGISTLKTEHVADFVMYAALGVVIGGRLGFCLFYDRALLWDTHRAVPFVGIIELWRGGMASHGGILGVIVAAILYARKHRQPVMFLFDLIGFAAPLGLFFGRIANFINGELYGHVCKPTLPWAVQFPQEIERWNADQLSQLTPLLTRLDMGNADTHTAWGLSRLLVEKVQAGHPEVIVFLRDVLPTRHPSQLYEALLEGICVFVAVAIVWYKPRKPGLVALTALYTYAVGRIIGEFFRVPDVDIPVWLGFTRGQWLSAVMLVGGVVLAMMVARRDVSPMGGWGGDSGKN